MSCRAYCEYSVLHPVGCMYMTRTLRVFNAQYHSFILALLIQQPESAHNVRRIYMCGMTHSCVWHDPFICVTWPIHMCDMTHSCDTWLIHVWYDPLIRDRTHSCVTWLIYSRAAHRTSRQCFTFVCVTWLIHMCDMTHSYVWHAHSYAECDLFVRVTKFIENEFICVTWLIHMCNLTHSTCDTTHLKLDHMWIMTHS